MNEFSQFSEEIFWQKSALPVPYPQAIEKMQLIVQNIAKYRTANEAHAPVTCSASHDNEREQVWLLEHPPVFTAGTSARAEDLFNPRNYPVYEAGRGGQWTYHGPGQRIAYIMLDLTKSHGIIRARDVHSYIHGLEEWLKTALRKLGVTSFTRPDRVGLWCIDPVNNQESKMAALGVRLSRWVSWHGIALNVTPDLEDFNGIIPCGIRDYGVTSLTRFTPGITMAEADKALAESWEAVFGTIPHFQL